MYARVRAVLWLMIYVAWILVGNDDDDDDDDDAELRKPWVMDFLQYGAMLKMVQLSLPVASTDTSLNIE